MSTNKEDLLKASDINNINNYVTKYLSYQYEFISRILTDLHLIKRKLGIDE